MIKHDLGLSDTQFGLLTGIAFTILFSLCSVPLGWLADRVDRRKMIATGLVFWSAMTAVSGIATTFGAFFLSRVGVGLGEACLVPAGISLLGSVMSKDQRARAVAIFLIGASLGNAISLIGGGYLLGLLSASSSLVVPGLGPLSPWRVLFLIACIPGLLTAVAFLALDEPKRPPIAAVFGPSLRNVYRHLASHRASYGFFTAAIACNVTLTQAYAAWLPLFYVRQFDIAPGVSAMLVGILFLLSAPIGQWAGGVLIDRFERQRVAAPASVVLAICDGLSLLPAAIFCTASSLSVSLLAYTVFSFLVSAATPCGYAGWQKLTPVPYQGLVIASLTSLVTLIGVGVGPVIIGVFNDDVFRNEADLGQSMLLLLTSAGVCGCCLALKGRRYFRDDAGLSQLPTA